MIINIQIDQSNVQTSIHCLQMCLWLQLHIRILTTDDRVQNNQFYLDKLQSINKIILANIDLWSMIMFDLKSRMIVTQIDPSLHLSIMNILTHSNHCCTWFEISRSSCTWIVISNVSCVIILAIIDLGSVELAILSCPTYNLTQSTLYDRSTLTNWWSNL